MKSKDLVENGSDSRALNSLIDRELVNAATGYRQAQGHLIAGARRRPAPGAAERPIIMTVACVVAASVPMAHSGELTAGPAR